MIGIVANQGKYKFLILAIEQVPISPPVSGSTREVDNDPSQIATRPKLLIIPQNNLPSSLLSRFYLSPVPAYLSLPHSKKTGPHEKEENNDERIKLVVLISTGSGTGAGQSVLFYQDVLEPTLSMLGIPPSSYTVQETTSADSIRNFARDVLGPNARSGIRQTVLLLSGDGGVHDLLNGLLAGVSSDITSPRVATASTGPMDLDRKVSHQESGYVTPTIALLALGTANALAHSLGTLQSHPSSLGLRTLFHGRVKPLPIFHAVFSPGARLLTDEGRSREQIPGNQNVIHGAVVFSYGLHASLVADSDSAAYRKFGAKRFQMAAKELLFPSDGGMPHAYRGKVSILRPNPTNIEADEGEGKRGEEKNEIWEDIPREEHAYVLATLVSNLEEKFMISPLSAISRPSHPVPSIAKEEAPAQDIQKKKKGRVNEGKMYLIHFPPLPGEEINRIMTLAYQGGQHVHEKAVGYEEVEGVRIELPSELDEHSGPGHGTQDRIQDEKQDDDEDNEARWRKICVDGTIIELERGGWVEMRKGPFISSSSHRVIQPIPSTSAYPKEIEEKNEATSVLNIVVPLKLR